MKSKIVIAGLIFAVMCLNGANARAQETAGAGGGNETRVALSEAAIAFDAAGRAALAGRLLTTQLAGTPDAPGRNSRFVVENRGANFYSYVSGWATFYDAQGVRCGEGLWKLEALAPGESAEVDTPGLRLTCAPASWRIVATNLVTRGTDTATKASPSAQAAESATSTASPETAQPGVAAPRIPPLEININGKTIPIQPGNPLEVTVGKERVRIIVSPAP